MTDIGLLKRLEALESEREILRLLHDYGRNIDYGDPSGWLDLFAPDARLELHYRRGLIPPDFGMPVQPDGRIVYEGRAGLETFIAAQSHAPNRYHKHVVTNARIDLDGHDARGEAFFLRVDEMNHVPVIVASGRYLDEYRRTPGKPWRFQRRIAEIEARLPPA